MTDAERERERERKRDAKKVNRQQGSKTVRYMRFTMRQERE